MGNVTFTNVVGALFNLYSSPITMTNISFVNVSGTEYDSVIKTIQSEVTIFDVQVTNFSGGYPGALFSFGENRYSPHSIVRIQGLRLENVTNCPYGCITVESAYFSLTNARLWSIPSNFISATGTEIALLRVTVLSTNMAVYSKEENLRKPKPNGGFLECVDCLQITISECRFENLIAQIGGVLYITYSNPSILFSTNKYSSLVQITDTVIGNSTAFESGGALYLAESSLYTSNVEFVNTTAVAGGAVTMSCSPYQTTYYCKYRFQSTVFRDTHADMGGAIYYDSLEPAMLDNVTFENTRASKYGPILAGVPAFLKVTNDSSACDVGNMMISSGVEVDCLLAYELYDSKDQLVKLTWEPSKTCSLSLLESVEGDTVARVLDGVCNFTQLRFVSQPGNQFKVNVTTSAIDYTVQEPNKGVMRVPITYAVTVANCARGSILINERCEDCQIGYYSFDTEDKFCSPCKTGMICNGRDEVLIAPGYWRNDSLSEDIFECSLRENCLGGNDSGTCKDGHIGRLCGVCNETWFRNGQYSCTQCGSPTQAMIFGILNMIGLLIFMVIIVVLSYRSAAKVAKTTSVLLRILLNFVQEIVILRNLDLNWPLQISNFFTGVKQTGNVNYSLISYSCMYGKTGTGTDTVFNDQEIVLYLPICAFLLCTVVWAIVALIRRELIYLKAHLVMTISVVHTTLLMHIFQTNLSMLSCTQKMEKDTTWLLSDLRVQCWVGKHLDYVLWYTLPSMVIWCFVLPVGILVLIVKYRKDLRTDSNLIRFSFLCKGYKPSMFFWTFLVIFKKYFILIETVLFSQQDPALPAIAVLVCLLLYIILQIYFKPYLKPTLNATETLAVGSSITMLLTGLTGSGMSKDMSTLVTVFVGISFVVLGLFFLCLLGQVVWALIAETKWVQTIKANLRRKKVAVEYDSVNQSVKSRDPARDSEVAIDPAEKDQE